MGTVVLKFDVEYQDCDEQTIAVADDLVNAVRDGFKTSFEEFAMKKGDEIVIERHATEHGRYEKIEAVPVYEDNTVYIANCIARIWNAPCVPDRERQRELDLGELVHIAATLGEKHAHAFAMALSKQAENGKYDRL